MERDIFITRDKTNCLKCNSIIEKGEFSELEYTEDSWEAKNICLECAGLGNLVYLPRGDAALSRRARKESEQTAIVYRYNRSQKRRERQGILIQPAALEKAKEQCLADEEERKKRRQKDRKRRARKELSYQERFAEKIRELYPNCPSGVPHEIASHACEVSSGRVGRCKDAKELDAEMIRRAVVAYIRHNETFYDELFGTEYMYKKDEARELVADIIRKVLEEWKGNNNK